MVEIKTSVAESSLDRAVGRATLDVMTCWDGDSTFREYILMEHMGQILHQMMVFSVNYCIYVSSAEVGIIYVLFVRCSDATLDLCNTALHTSAYEAVAWAHHSDEAPPSFATTEVLSIIQKQLPFWRIINGYVKEKGPFPPLKLFKHGAQSLYSKTKGGVDGSAQARSILCCSTSSFPWEQKIVSQTLKTLAVNALIAWRMAKPEDLLCSKAHFGSLEQYRDAVNSVQALADFVFDVSKELLAHADKLERDQDDHSGDTEAIGDEESARLQQIVRRQGKRLLFFNSADGVKLRLGVRTYQQKHLPGVTVWCTLCGTSTSGQRMHRFAFKCASCDVHLCVRTYPGQRKSCWSLWHEAQRLTPRTGEDTTPATGLSRDQEDASAEGDGNRSFQPFRPRRRCRSEELHPVGPRRRDQRTNKWAANVMMERKK